MPPTWVPPTWVPPTKVPFPMTDVVRRPLAWSRPPRLLVGEAEQHRQASWLELLFDLVFAAAVAQLGAGLAGDLSWAGFGRLVGYFVPVWWAWTGFTFYGDRFDSDDVVYRLTVLAAMAGVGAMTATVERSSTGFAIAYIAVRVILVALYLRARHHEPAARSFVSLTAGVFSLGISCWLLSLALPEPARFWLWGLGLLIEAVTPFFASGAVAKMPLHSGHVPERFGSFTIVAMGETVLVATLGLAGQDWDTAAVIVAGCGFLIVAGLWWVYFDSVTGASVRAGHIARTTFIFGHLPLLVGLTALGAGVGRAIDEAASPGRLERGVGVVAFGGAALFLVALAAVHASTVHRVADRVAVGRVICAGGLVVVGAASSAVAPAAAIAAALVVGLVVSETLGSAWVPPAAPTRCSEADRPRRSRR